MKRSLPFAILVALVGGCGTVANLEEGGSAYGGVRRDVEKGNQHLADWANPSGHCIPPCFNFVAGVYRLGFDLPLSLIGDTITLPMTLRREETQ